MSRHFRWCLFGALAVLLVARPAMAQTVDELVAKNLQARGGIDRIKAIQTLKQVARLNTHNTVVPMTMYAKRPNMTRKELALPTQRMLFVFDGTSAWETNPNGSPEPIVITGPELEGIKQESDFDTPFVDYKARGYTIEFAGAETIGMRRFHHLTVTKNGVTQDCYLDADTGLEARTVNKSPMGLLEQEFSDYRDVQGIKMPFLVRTLQNGAPEAEIRIQSIEINGVIDDALFRKPGK